MSYFPMGNLKVVLSASQLLTLNSDPVLLVPGKTGCVIELSSVYYRYLHGSTPFNPGDTDMIALTFGPVSSGNVVVVPAPASGFIDQSVDQSAWSNPNWTGIVAYPAFPISGYVGGGISLTQYAGVSFPEGTDWTQGNGQLAVFLTYAYLEI